MPTRLYRSTTDKMLGGVCGGLAPYLGVDVTLVRLIFVLLAMADGVGVLVYFALWILLPTQDRVEETWEENVRHGADDIAERAREIGQDLRAAARDPQPQAALVVGIIVIALGTILLLRALDWAWLNWLDLNLLWPVLLIAAGVAIILRRPARTE